MANERDILNRPLIRTLVYGAPILAIVAMGPLKPSRLTTGIVWFVSLGVMGGACLWNAWRCGRVHCYRTGPFFLLIGVIALLHGLELLSLGNKGWLWLGSLLLFGCTGLTVLPEKIWGNYRRRQ
jgi:hypothetical protein